MNVGNARDRTRNARVHLFERRVYLLAKPHTIDASIEARLQPAASAGPRYVQNRRRFGHVSAICPWEGRMHGIDARKLRRLVDCTQSEQVTEAGEPHTVVGANPKE
jgi:hypothetical protein